MVAYVQECDLCSISKTVKDNPYNNLQSMPVATYYWKNLWIYFITRLSCLTD